MKKLVGIVFVGIVLLTACISNKEAVQTGPQLPPPPPYTGPKKDVDGIVGILYAHPDTLSLVGKNNIRYYFLYDYPKKCLHFTSRLETYNDIINWLPIIPVAGNYARLESPIIDLLTYFDSKQADELETKLGISLRDYKIGRILNYNTLVLNEDEAIVNGEVVLKTAAATTTTTTTPKSSSSGNTSGFKYNGTGRN